MIFLTTDESRQWSTKYGYELNDRGFPTRSAEEPYVRCALPKRLSQLIWFCRFIGLTLQPKSRSLLWVTLTGIWPSSENWHIYYRLKEGYGGHESIENAPGHLFLEHEQQDLVTFLQLGITFGWEMQLLPTKGFARTFLSHDEFVEFSTSDSAVLRRIKTEITEAGFDLLPEDQ